MRCKQGCGIVLAFMCILALFSCSNEDDREWFETKEEAIEYGTSKVEGDLKSTLLSTEEYEGETIVFYDYGGALGVASISRAKKDTAGTGRTPTWILKATAKPHTRQQASTLKPRAD